MLKIIAIMLVHTAGLASIVGWYLSAVPNTNERVAWHWAAIAIYLILAATVLVNEIYSIVKSSPKKYKNKCQINNFMKSWVSSAGRVVIFSRDMSWTDAPEIRSLLSSKATRNELIIILEHETDLTKQLQKCGAMIVTYKELGHVPRSRFTIVDLDRHGARVAIGIKINGVHHIQTFQDGTDPFFAVTEDLVKLLIGYSARVKNVPAPQ